MHALWYMADALKPCRLCDPMVMVFRGAGERRVEGAAARDGAVDGAAGRLGATATEGLSTFVVAAEAIVGAAG